MIIWYCDICGKRIADDGVICYGKMPVWELSAYITPQRYTESKKTIKYLEVIVCEDCKECFISKTKKMIQEVIKDRKEKEKGKE